MASASAATSDSPSGAAKSSSYSTDPALYLYTSLTAGSSHIVTATSRLETILRANRVPFKAIDIATDEKARMLWGRRAGKDEGGRVRKLPGLVQMGLVLGDLVEIEDWNEYGELKQHVTIYYDEHTQPPISQAPKPPAAPAKPAVPPAAAAAAAAGAVAAAAAASSASSTPVPPPLPASKPAAEGQPLKMAGPTVTLPIRSVAEEAAQKAKQLHLQSLREKVHGKAGVAAAAATDKDKSSEAEGKEKVKEKEKKESEEEESDEDESEEDDEDEEEVNASKLSKATAAGLQSPTSTGWKGASSSGAPPTVQSPTTTSWKPTDVDAPITSFLGSLVENASAEEIAAVERAETIKEEPEPEEEEDDEEDDDDSDEEEEEEKKKPPKK